MTLSLSSASQDLEGRRATSLSLSRRRLLGLSGVGMGTLALGDMPEWLTDAHGADEPALTTEGIGDVKTPRFHRRDIGVAPDRMHEPFDPRTKTLSRLEFPLRDGEEWKYLMSDYCTTYVMTITCTSWLAIRNRRARSSCCRRNRYKRRPRTQVHSLKNRGTSRGPEIRSMLVAPLVSRQTWLRAGSAAALVGLCPPQSLKAEQSRPQVGSGKAKRVIFPYLPGMARWPREPGDLSAPIRIEKEPGE